MESNLQLAYLGMTVWLVVEKRTCLETVIIVAQPLVEPSCRVVSSSYYNWFMLQIVDLN